MEGKQQDPKKVIVIVFGLGEYLSVKSTKQARHAIKLNDGRGNLKERKNNARDVED